MTLPSLFSNFLITAFEGQAVGNQEEKASSSSSTVNPENSLSPEALEKCDSYSPGQGAYQFCYAADLKPGDHQLAGGIQETAELEVGEEAGKLVFSTRLFYGDNSWMVSGENLLYLVAESLDIGYWFLPTWDFDFSTGGLIKTDDNQFIFEESEETSKYGKGSILAGQFREALGLEAKANWSLQEIVTAIHKILEPSGEATDNPIQGSSQILAHFGPALNSLDLGQLQISGMEEGDVLIGKGNGFSISSQLTTGSYRFLLGSLGFDLNNPTYKINIEKINLPRLLSAEVPALENISITGDAPIKALVLSDMSGAGVWVKNLLTFEAKLGEENVKVQFKGWAKFEDDGTTQQASIGALNVIRENQAVLKADSLQLSHQEEGSLVNLNFENLFFDLSSFGIPLSIQGTGSFEGQVFYKESGELDLNKTAHNSRLSFDGLSISLAGEEINLDGIQFKVEPQENGAVAYHIKKEDELDLRLVQQAGGAYKLEVSQLAPELLNQVLAIFGVEGLPKGVDLSGVAASYQPQTESSPAKVNISIPNSININLGKDKKGKDLNLSLNGLSLDVDLTHKELETGETQLTISNFGLKLNDQGNTGEGIVQGPVWVRLADKEVTATLGKGRLIVAKSPGLLTDLHGINFPLSDLGLNTTWGSDLLISWSELIFNFNPEVKQNVLSGAIKVTGRSGDQDTAPGDFYKENKAIVVWSSDKKSLEVPVNDEGDKLTTKVVYGFNAGLGDIQRDGEDSIRGSLKANGVMQKFIGGGLFGAMFGSVKSVPFSKVIPINIQGLSWFTSPQPSEGGVQ